MGLALALTLSVPSGHAGFAGLGELAPRGRDPRSRRAARAGTTTGGGTAPRGEEGRGGEGVTAPKLNPNRSPGAAPTSQAHIKFSGHFFSLSHRELSSAQII